jgi:multidrug resistance efflux pump
MAIRDWWDKWVYAVAKPASVANREHTAEEVRNEVGAATFAGTSRGLGVGVCTGVVLGACLPVVLWFLLHQPASTPKPNVNESELRQLRAENERLGSLLSASASKPSVDENELKQMRAENKTLRAENEQLKSQLAVAEKAKEEAKPEVAETPKTKRREQPKGTLQGTKPPSTYVCGDGRTVTNPADCRSKGG